jgi:hypothetical protein
MIRSTKPSTHEPFEGTCHIQNITVDR